MKTILGDCLEVMKELESNSVDAIVTDPPYGLSFMGKRWDYDVPSVAVWVEALRVLKPGGHLLSFGGTRTYHRMVVNVEDAGFEVRDQIQWLYGSGFPKSHNLPGGIGTALKPANEPIVLARKPLIGTIAKNVEKFGTGGLNIDESRISGEPWKAHTATGLGSVKFFTEGETKEIEKSPHAQGRWPANVLLDEDAAALLDEQTAGVIHGAGKARTSEDGSHSGGDSIFGKIGGPAMRFGDSGGASRFFYVAKASKRERNAGLEGMQKKEMVNAYNFSEDGSFTKNNTAKSGVAQRKPTENHHPTVKPIKLMQYLIRLVTPKGGLILDPFMGSGSTGCAATSLGYDFIGIEMNPEYKEIADRRIDFHSVWPESPDAEVTEEQTEFELEKEA